MNVFRKFNEILNVKGRYGWDVTPTHVNFTLIFYSIYYMQINFIQLFIHVLIHVFNKSVQELHTSGPTSG